MTNYLHNNQYLIQINIPYRTSGNQWGILQWHPEPKWPMLFLRIPNRTGIPLPIPGPQWGSSGTRHRTCRNLSCNQRFLEPV